MPAAAEHRGDQPEVTQPAVHQHQTALGQALKQGPAQGQLAVVVAAQLEVDDGVRQYLAQRQHRHLREGGGAVLVAGRAEVPAVVGCVGQLEDRAVQSQQAPGLVVGAGQRRGGADEPAEQRAQGPHAEAFAGVDEGGGVRLNFAQRAQLQPDVGQALVAPQRAGDDEVDDVVRRQQALALAAAAGVPQRGQDDLHGAEQEEGGGQTQLRRRGQVRVVEAIEGAPQAAEQLGERGGLLGRRW